MKLTNLTETQLEILDILSEIKPPWTLVGGGALLLAYLDHRKTKDLDLFWRDFVELDQVEKDIEDRLRDTGFGVEVVQRSSRFIRLSATKQDETVVLDLVQDMTPPVRPDVDTMIGGKNIKVADRYEILVNKICSLLSRLEIRDLHDVKELLESGENLEVVLQDAPKQDGGFSPLTLAWALEGFEVEKISKRSGIPEEQAIDLDEFRKNLISQLLKLAKPDNQEQ